MEEINLYPLIRYLLLMLAALFALAAIVSFTRSQIQGAKFSLLVAIAVVCVERLVLWFSTRSATSEK